ncbi:hypothetical protein Pla108_30470 [Botrimarina colliarenosi]|uniref:PEP-CTERM protein-sorting domain-containing protein n=1 Tax=Botrimarina colliarenosi TaxID=2528001 RepID=A0A5C6A8S9_9BACT|nr:hypothetical protein [Botrimarina colliarenosi]TWT95969.1 hypothetical protein Pla108_30470 [Botrimarina colliarenosi]
MTSLLALTRTSFVAVSVATFLTLWLASVAPAAKFVPVMVDDAGLPIGEGAAVSIDYASVYAPGDSADGQSELVPPGDYRVAIDSASATMHVDLSASRLSLETFAAALDVNTDDFYYTESSPDIRKAWFYVAPTGSDFLGKPVVVNLGLAWKATQTTGARPTATLSTLAGVTLNTLTSRADFETATLLVGGYYRLDLTHQNEVRGSALLSAADFEVSFQPLTSLTAPTPILPGDYNGDGKVNAADYTMLRDRFGKPYDFALDGDGDGSIGQGDYNVWSTWYDSSMAASFAVPEPSAASTLVLFAVAGAIRRSRRL